MKEAPSGAFFVRVSAPIIVLALGATSSRFSHDVQAVLIECDVSAWFRVVGIDLAFSECVLDRLGD
jgi:hypothetical protein